MKKIIILFLLLFAYQLKAQTDSNWITIPNTLDGKYTRVTNDTAKTLTGTYVERASNALRAELVYIANDTVNIKLSGLSSDLIDSLQSVIITPSIDTIIYIDSVGAGDSVKLFDTRGYDMALLYITANADTTLDTMILYTVTASGGTYPIGVKLLYGNSDETFIASNATSNVAGLSYFIFSPYPETLMIRLINTYYLDVRKVYFELHLIRKR